MGDIPGSPTSHHHRRATAPVPNPTTSQWQLPPHPSASIRSTPDLPGTADIVVVGSGITAAFACLQFEEEFRSAALESKPRLLVLEARTLCSGATGRNGGHVVVDPEAKPERSRWERERGYRDVKRVVEEVVGERGGGCEFREVRGCMAWWDRGMWKGVKREVLGKEGHGMEGVQVVEGRKELEELGLRGGAMGALVGDGLGAAMTLNPYRLVCGVWEGLLADGVVQVQTGTVVEGVVEGAGDGGGWRVRTQRGDVQTKHVVVATNGYVSQLLERLVSAVRPVQGQMSALVPPKKWQGKMLGHDYGLMGLQGQDKVMADYLVQRPWDDGGYLMYGGARQWVKGGGEGVSDDSYNDEEAVMWLRGLPQRIDVGTEDDEIKLERAWTGVMGYSIDHCPWAGGMPGMECVWVSAGYTGHGMPNAPGCGRHIARLVATAWRGDDWRQREMKAVENGEILADFVLCEERLSRSEVS